MQPDIQTVCCQLRKYKPLKHIAKELGLPYQVIGRMARGYLFKNGPHNKTIETKLRRLHKSVMQNQTKQPTTKNAPFAGRGSL